MIDYNLEYYENMLRMYSTTAERISKIRWEFIKDLNVKTVLDYGSGVGWFRAWRPREIEVHSFDIGPYPQTEAKYLDYDLLTLWDVLEHLPSMVHLEYWFDRIKYIALTTPVLPNNAELKDWKHFKPGEHLNYYDRKSLDSLFREYKFKRIKDGYPECPPRVDIWSVVYKKNRV